MFFEVRNLSAYLVYVYLPNLSCVRHTEGTRLPSNNLTLLCRFQGWLLYFSKDSARPCQGE